MPKLPNEEKFKVEIRIKLKKHFDLARRLLRFATHIFTGKREPTLNGGVDEMVAILSFGLLAKMSKQYRSILLLAEHGLSNDALCLSRMLFESMLAVQFILRRKVNLRLVKVGGKTMSSRFRANLYLANHAFQRWKQIKCMKEMPGYRRLFSKTELAVGEKEIKAWECRIGAEWTARLRKGYSGLSVKDLAACLHFEAMYHGLYREASIGVHGADGSEFVRFEDIGNGKGQAIFDYTPGDKEIAITIGYSNLMLAHSIDVINKRMKFGIERMVLRFINQIIELNELTEPA